MSDRTEAQRIASRENGRKSYGPITVDGKLKSRQNALKHGLTAEVVLPPDLKNEIESEIDIYTRHHKPQNAFEERLVQKAAVSSVKFLRLSQAELARADDRQRNALSEWDKTHQEKGAELATLIVSRTIETTEIERANAYVAIQHNSAGLRLMAQAWDDLIDALDQHYCWNELQAHTAARLLGYFRPLKPDDTPPAFANLLADANKTVGGLSGRIAPEEGGMCVRALRELAVEERTRLRMEADHLWQSRESQSRKESLARALADPTPEGQLLQRYLNDAHRTEEQALKTLAAS